MDETTQMFKMFAGICSAIVTQREELREDFSELKKELSKLRQELSDEKGKNAHTRDLLESRYAMFVASQHEVSRLRAEQYKQEIALDEERKKREALEAKVEALEAQVDAEIEERSEQVCNLSCKFSDCDENIDTLFEHKDALQKKIKALDGRLKVMVAEDAEFETFTVHDKEMLDWWSKYDKSRALHKNGWRELEHIKNLRGKKGLRSLACLTLHRIMRMSDDHMSDYYKSVSHEHEIGSVVKYLDRNVNGCQGDYERWRTSMGDTRPPFRPNIASGHQPIPEYLDPFKTIASSHT